MNRYLLRFWTTVLTLGWSIRIFAADPTNALPKPTVSYLTPAAEAQTFVMQDGYKMELVLSDPVIKEPVLTAFDGNGRMFVAEMRSYMQDIDGTNQRATNSRVSVHWSSKHNGVYDKHSVFVDHLILPRMVLPLAHGVVINETDSDDFWLYTDTKGNGVADKKELFFNGGGRGGNLEHQAGGIIWDLDNWIYLAVNAYRLRYEHGKVVRENVPPNGGQWGLCQDDYGKPWVMNAGYESGPINFEAPYLYGIFNYPEQLVADYSVVWPLIGLADVQGGTSRFRPEEKSLNHFTATCGDEIYRGDRLPADLRGDLLFCEPVGRLIRRSKIEVKDAFTYLTNPYEKQRSEFILSTDPNFRPVNMANAPDGTLYITDMYRGIIQEKDWVGQGSYLRGVVEQYQLEKNFGRGRIWRLTNKDFKPGPQPHMIDESSAKLVTYLDHPNGWWRDTAQKLLVLRGDKSVAPTLNEMARTSTNHLARLHALWTLEGLGALEPALIREKLKDPHPQLRIAAIRASQTLYKNGDHSLVPDISALAKDRDPDVVLQVVLTASFLQWPNWQIFARTTVDASHAFGVQRMGGQVTPANSPPAIAPGQPAPMPTPPPHPIFSASERQVLDRGEIIFKQLCFACHGMDGAGTPLQGSPGSTMGPPLRASQTATGYRDGIIDVVLKGLSGPVNGKDYTALMVPMESNDDAWIAAVTSYIRNSFGNRCSFVTTNDVARVRAADATHTNTWTLQELHDTLPQPIPDRQRWKLTASHNPGSLPQAIDGDAETRYESAAAQAPGMWVQIELPEPTEITGVELDTENSPDDYAHGYTIQLSDDGATWGLPVAAGTSTALHNQIIFPPRTTRFIRINQTGSDSSHWWSIHELQVLQMPTPPVDPLQPPDLFSGTNAVAPAANPKPEAGFNPLATR